MMGMDSNIEWTDSTWNGWIGCQRVGPGCDHCYAEAMMDKRLRKVKWGAGEQLVRTSAANWRQPIAWDAAHAEFFAQHGRRRRVFCASLADVFDNAVDPAWRRDLFDLIEQTPNLNWLLLTKRIGNVLDLVSRAKSRAWLHERENVWLGITVVNQAEADRDIPKLLTVPARVRFLSMEPLLGPVDLTRIGLDGYRELYPLAGTTGCEDDDGNPAPDLPAIDWVIVGGETGAGARPKHPAWTRAICDQCTSAGVPFHLKAWGEWAPGENVERHHGTIETATWHNDQWVFGRENLASADGHVDDEPDLYRVGKKAAGRLLDGVEHNGYPSVP